MSRLPDRDTASCCSVMLLGLWVWLIWLVSRERWRCCVERNAAEKSPPLCSALPASSCGATAKHPFSGLALNSCLFHLWLEQSSHFPVLSVPSCWFGVLKLCNCCFCIVAKCKVLHNTASRQKKSKFPIFHFCFLNVFSLIGVWQCITLPAVSKPECSKEALGAGRKPQSGQAFSCLVQLSV